MEVTVAVPTVVRRADSIHPRDCFHRFRLLSLHYLHRNLPHQLHRSPAPIRRFLRCHLLLPANRM